MPSRRSGYGRRELPSWSVDLAYVFGGLLLASMVGGLLWLIVSQRAAMGR